MQKISKLIRWANLVIILLTFLSYLAPYINPSYFWPLAFFGIIYPWLLLFNILFILLWIFRKDYYLFFSLACIIMGWNHLVGFVGWNTPAIKVSQESVHVLSYNVKRGKKLNNELDAQQSNPPELFNLLYGQVERTFLCFQEYGSVEVAKMAERGFEHYHKLAGSGTVILSPFPFLSKGGKKFEKTSNSYIWVDVKVGTQILRIFNIHLQSNYVSGVTDKVIQKGDFQEKETWRDIRTVIRRIKTATNARSQQALIVAREIAASPYPVIVCGDFNDTPQSFTYQTVSDGLQDSFKEKGRGFGTTYAGLIPALRIDYILADQQFRILDNVIPRVSLSDHYPVISHLELYNN